jgi:uncharacterized protein
MSEATDVLLEFLGHIEKLDVPACAALLADDAQMVSPLAPAPIPKHISGRDAIVDTLRMLPQMFKSYEFHDLHTFAAEPDAAFVLAQSSCTLANDAPYEQDYVFFARVRDGAIVEYREYMDPVRVGAVFAAMGA